MMARPVGLEQMPGITATAEPGGAAAPAATGIEALEAAAEEHRIDCRPMTTHGLNGLRVSLSIFNSEDQVNLLLTALGEAPGGLSRAG